MDAGDAPLRIAVEGDRRPRRRRHARRRDLQEVAVGVGFRDETEVVIEHQHRAVDRVQLESLWVVKTTARAVEVAVAGV